MPSSEIEASWVEEHNEVPNISEFDTLKARLRSTEDRLRTLSEGVRFVANQLIITSGHRQLHGRRKSTDSDDNHTHATTEETVISEDRGCLKENSVLPMNDIVPPLLSSEPFPLMPEADLLALQNAAQMMKEHARLTAQEASLSVEDTIHAQAEALHWRRRAIAAEADLDSLRTEFACLKSQNHKLKSERKLRKLLVKEVRQAHKELSQYKMQHISGQLENYVTEALHIHENQLRKTLSGTGSTPSIAPSYSLWQGNNGNDKSTVEQNTDEEKTPRVPPLDSIDFGPQQDQSPPNQQIKASNLSQTQSSEGNAVNPPDSPDSIGKNVSWNDNAVSPITFSEFPNEDFAEASSSCMICDPSILRSLALPQVDK